MQQKIMIFTTLVGGILLLQGCSDKAVQVNTEQSSVLTMTEELITNPGEIVFDQFDFSDERIPSHDASDIILLQDYQEEPYSFHYSLGEELLSTLLFEPYNGQVTFSFSTGGFEVSLYQYNGKEEKETVVGTKYVDHDSEQIITFTNLSGGAYYFELHSDTEQEKVGQGQVM